MNWQSASEFWAMRGYGLYVWGSYAMTLALMLFEIAATRRGRAARLAAAARSGDPIDDAQVSA